MGRERQKDTVEAMMGGKAKIEALTNSWYGFAVFSALYSLASNGIGFFSITFTLLGLVFWWVLTFFLGRALVNKSALVRALLVMVSALFSVLGALAAVRTTWSFVRTWELGLLLTAGYSAVHTWMYAKSFRTLTDPSVKAYFG